MLITSRRATWDPSLGVQTHALGTLPRLESIALLRKLRPDLAEDDPDLAAIAAELGDLPLALHLAGQLPQAVSADTTRPSIWLSCVAPRCSDHESLQGLDLTVSPTNHTLHIGRTLGPELQPARSFQSR